MSATTRREERKLLTGALNCALATTAELLSRMRMLIVDRCIRPGSKPILAKLRYCIEFFEDDTIAHSAKSRLGMYSTKYFTLTLRGPKDASADISDDQAQKIYSTAAQFRGEVINELIHLENKIELLLSRYFGSTIAKQNFFRWNVLRSRLQFKYKAVLLFDLLKGELKIECSTVKGHVSELTTIRNRLAHGDVVFDISTATLCFDFRKGEYIVGDSFKGEIDAKVQSVDTFLSDLLKDQRFAEANS